ncbi:YfgM family protein [Marinobacter zhejiangensis]|uniref:Putative negative regulator of RcsB-dependent stress response n=1 Tax=Marinobacter zhejiangensis TaxID=488535 RepID=A0A1I4P9K0_9GAMM|nr:tetratricopeptide repeat protein [Marinobacter zhejiangensis]SFM24246.1 Putative negative regulator of RcsB-dependent stress response [Marinobacter zhejiangensis]
MAELRTEEEQIQAIKNWWKNNGSSLLIGIGAALAIVFGWQAWQKNQAEQQSAAAAEFANLLAAYSDQTAEGRVDTIGYVADQLRGEYGDSAYAVYGTLMEAQVQLTEQEDAAAAIESLQWAHARADKQKALELIIRSRLARAQLAGGELDSALATVRGAVEPGSFKGLLAELEGDILLAKGDKDAAVAAYITAREESLSTRNGVLNLKLADLGVGEDS